MHTRTNSLRILALAAAAACGRPSGSILLQSSQNASQTLSAAPELMAVHLLHDRDLNPAQAGQLASIRHGLLQQQGDFRLAIQTARNQVAAELAKSAPDATVVNGLVDQVLAQQSKLAHGAADQVLTLGGTLSSAQRGLLLTHFNAPVTQDTFSADVKAAASAGLQLTPDEDGTPVRTVASMARGKGLHPETMVLATLDKAQLTSGQLKQLKAARKQIRAERLQLAQLIDATSPQLIAELQKSAPDTAAVHAVVEQSLASYAKMAHDAVNLALSLRAQLTDAQVAPLAN